MSDDPRTDGSWLDSNRRDVLKAVGAGGALSLVGGAAVTGVVGTNQSDDADGEGAETATPDGDGDTATVHVVEMLVHEPATHPDRPADFLYQPTGLHVQPGDVVKWVATTPDHNVVSYHPAFGMNRRVPTGVDAFSSPLLGWTPDSIPDDAVEPPAGPGEGGEPGEPTVTGTMTETEVETETGTTTGTEMGTTTEVGTPDGGGTTTGTETGTPDGGLIGTETGTDDETLTGTPTEAPVVTGTETATGTPVETPTPDGIGTETPTVPGTSTADGEAAPVPQTYLYAFEEPGVYDLLCSPHETYGMAMRVVVGDVTEASFETSDPDALAPPRAGPAGLARLTLTDPALEPDAIVQEGSVAWEDLEANGDAADGDESTPDDESS